MKRLFILFLTVAVLVSCMVVPALAYTDTRVYDVDGGWTVQASNDTDGPHDIPYTNPSSPLFVFDEGDHSFMIMNSGFVMPSGECTVYGRFKIDFMPTFIQINRLTADLFFEDGYLYFSASGVFDQNAFTYFDFPGLGIALVDRDGHPTSNVQLDYVYLRTESFVSLPYQASVNGRDSWDQAAGTRPQIRLYDGYDDLATIVPEGAADIPELGSTNYHNVVVVIPTSQYVDLSNSALGFSFRLDRAGFVGAYVYDSVNDPLFYSANVTFDNISSQTHYYQDSVEAFGDYEIISHWEGEQFTSQTGLDSFVIRPSVNPEGDYSLSYLKYTDFLNNQFSYDVPVSSYGSQYVDLYVDLSGADLSREISVSLYFVGGPEGSDLASYFVPVSCGIFLDAADVDLGENQLFFKKITRFFEDLFGNLMTTLHNGFNALLGSDTPPEVVGELESSGEVINQFEHDQQAVLEDNKDIFVNTFDVSMFASSLGFVSGYLTSFFNALGIYQIVFIMPIVLGMFLYICQHVRGFSHPNKHNFVKESHQDFNPGKES